MTKNNNKKLQVNSNNYNWDAEVISGNAATGEQYSVKRNVRTNNPVTREEMEKHWKEMDKEAENLRNSYPDQVASVISYQDETGNQVIRFTPTSELIFPVGVPIYDEWGKEIIGRNSIRKEVEKRREEWAKWEREGKLSEQVEIHHTDDGKTVQIKFRVAPKRLHPNEIKVGTDWIIESATKKRKGQHSIENNQNFLRESGENPPWKASFKLLGDEEIEKANSRELMALSERIMAELERRKNEQNSGVYQVSSEKLEQQLQKSQSVLNKFSTSPDNLPKSSNTLPVVGVVSIVASLVGGLVAWKRK